MAEDRAAVARADTRPRAARQDDASPLPPIAASRIEAFYREFFRPLVRRARRRYGLGREDARDVAQEAFVLALLKMKWEGNAEAWLYQVVDRLSANLRRKTSRRADLLARWIPGDGRRENQQFGEREG